MDEGAKSLSRKRVMLVFASLIIAMVAASLDQTIVSTALPTVAGELDGADQIFWITTAYMLASSVMMPAYGKLGDQFGRRPFFLFCMACFVAGSLICALAQSMLMLIAGRAVQGLGGGGLMVLSQAIVADIFPPKERGKYMGIIGASFSLSTILGPLLGGWFTAGPGWRWCFWINLPLGILSLAFATAFLPKRTSSQEGGKVDYAGIALAAAFSVCLVLAMTWKQAVPEAPTWALWAIVGATAVFGVLLAIVELRRPDAVIPLRFFGNRNFALCTAGCLLMMVGMMGVTSYMPTYFQIVNDMDAVWSGYMVAVMSVGTMVSSVLSGFLIGRMRRVKLLPVASCAVSAILFWALSSVVPDTPLWLMGAYLFALGVGSGLGMQSVVLIAQNEFSVKVVGAATATITFFREIGGTIGAALVGALFTANLGNALESNLADFGGAGALGFDATSLTPALARTLDVGVQEAVRLSYNEALTPVFLVLVPVFVAGAVMLACCKNTPLKETND